MGLTYEHWTELVNRILETLHDTTCSGGADWPQRQCYDNELNPIEAAVVWEEYNPLSI